MTKEFLPTQLEQLEARQFLSTTAPPYLVPSNAGVTITPIITTGDRADNGYRMVGIPDGLGAFDNGDGTFTVLMNHELRSTQGITRAHGNKGAFVSKWIINKSTGEVLSGQDQIKKVFLYDTVTKSYVNASPAFNRFCSANLAAPSAFFNPATGLGTQERIFTDGEEFQQGRAMAHIVSTGDSYELAALGNLSYENVVASPSGALIEIAHHNPDLFDPNLLGPGLKGPNFLTQDEESSGIIDVSGIFGPGTFLTVVQAHFTNTDPELVEGGQLLLIHVDGSVTTTSAQPAASSAIQKAPKLQRHSLFSTRSILA